MSAGPLTKPVVDAQLPELEVLTGEGANPFLESVVDSLGFRLRVFEISQVRYVPSRSVVVQYGCKVLGPDGRRDTLTIVASAGLDLPEPVPVLAADGLEVGFWMFPNDPFLPGLARATDHESVAGLLAQLDAPPKVGGLRTRAYRPGRRAVVEVTGNQVNIFLKVVRPAKVESLQVNHSTLAEHVPIPHTYGFSRDLGLVALQALPGRTLRNAIEARVTTLPKAIDLVGLLDSLPKSSHLTAVTPIAERVGDHASILSAVRSELADRISAVVEEVGRLDDDEAVPVHGDFHSSQILVRGSEIVGLVDVDTVGLGTRADDYANILAHLSTLATASRSKRDLDRYGKALVDEFDSRTNPVNLRVRVAGHALGLATGPYRVQSPRWEAETEQRVKLAETWLASAGAIR